jgi:NADPH:quinone reductase-like Zn-dependent oxidoreductase
LTAGARIDIPSVIPASKESIMRAMGSTRSGIEAIVPVEIAPATLGAGQVRVQVVASALNPADLMVQRRALTGRLLHSTRPPIVPGYDFSGVVSEVGPGAAGWTLGDEVFGHLAYSGKTRQGACAESVVADAAAVARKPAAVDHAQAASAATPGLTALQFLRDLGRLKAGQRLLVLGASGGVGTCATGIGKRLGAHVTAACSGYAVEHVRRLGADEVIDRARQDPLAPAEPYDVVLDTSASYGYLAVARALGPSGVLVTTLPGPAVLVGKVAALFSRRRCEFGAVQSRRADLEQVGAWLAGGMLVPIAQRFPVREVGAGLARLAGGGLLGRIAIEVRDGF